MPKKYYAVRQGRTTGIFLTWDECKKSVIGYKNAIYKSFLTKEEAEEFLNRGNDSSSNSLKNNSTDEKNYHNSDEEVYSQIQDEFTMIAYIDGSYDDSSKSFAYAGIYFTNKDKETFSITSDDKSVSSMRNVAGEVNASMYVMKKALEFGIKELYIYFDYMGIESWAVGDWKTNNHLTQGYKKFYDSIKKDLTVHFCKVKSHTKVKYNEIADKLAKEALGIKL